MPSDVTARAQALVAERLPLARGLGDNLDELIAYPEEFAAVLREGLMALGDEAYRREQERVSPGSGVIFGVRSPLLAAVMRRLREPLQETSPALALNLAERLVAEQEREYVFFVHLALERVLPTDPERAWQLMRRLARDAHDWIRVDSLAPLYAKGMLAERVRWAEIEQLVFSRSEWERRLVGATIASMPFVVARSRRAQLASAPALELIGSLIGDSSETVCKSLSWALRSWREVDPSGVDDLLLREARRAAETNDGNRAWVIRDAMKEQRTPVAMPVQAKVRALLGSVRRGAGSESTSEAAEIAAKFVGFDGMSDAAVRMQGDRQRMAGSRV